MCGKLSYMTLMGINHFERENDLCRVEEYIKHNYNIGDYVHLDDVADHLGIEPLSDEEASYIIEKLEK